MVSLARNFRGAQLVGELEAPPVIDHGFALYGRELVDGDVAINRIVGKVRRRDLLEHATRVGPETVPDAGQHQQRIAARELPMMPIEIDAKGSPQHEECFLLALVEMP